MSDSDTQKDKEPLLVRVIEDDELSSFEERSISFARWGIGIAIFTILIGVGTAIVFWGQFRETWAQTDILAISGRQARRDSAESSINTAKQIAIAQQQANAAQESVKAIRRQFAFAQRPWIQVDTGFAIRQSDVWVGNDSSGNSIHKHPSEFMKFPNQMILGDSPVDFTATFRNTGLSPAINE